MKIAFIISSLGSGGAERVLTLIANYFSKNNDVTILTFSNSEPFYPLNNNIKHIKLDLIKKSHNIFETLINSIKRVLLLKKVLKEIDADINISFMTHTNIISIIATKLNRQKIIISEDIEYFFYNNRILFLVRKIVYRWADYLVVKTYGDKKNYYFLNKIAVIGNPLQDNLEEFDFDQKEKLILAVGRLDRQKGFDNLIKAYSKLNTNWKLFIAGEGKERKSLINLIKKLGLDSRVILLGNQKDIFNWYKRASIFVLSSRKEGFGNVLIEAMAMGCAVVSFDCPYGPGEIIEDRVNGILVENQNIDKLALAIQELIDNDKLRETLSKEAIKVREKYNIKNIAKRWEEVIKKVIDE